MLQFELYDIVNISRFIAILLQVIGAIGLIIVGSSRIRKNNTINNSVVFAYIGLIEALVLVVNERILDLLTVLGGSVFLDYLRPIFYVVLIQMLPNLVSLTTFGALFLFLGTRNKQNYGKFLMFSGIFWVIFGAISILIYSNYLLLDILAYYHISNPFPYIYFLIMEFVWAIIPIFTVISSVFFLIYAIKIKVKTLLFCSIIFLVATSLSAVASILELIWFIFF